MSSSQHTTAHPPAQDAAIAAAEARNVKWGWACRAMARDAPLAIVPADRDPPQAGDVALLRVESIGHHGKLETADEGRMRLYPGDHVAGVFGNRYATSAYEGEVLGVDEVHMLTAAGMVGTVRSMHRSMKPPTRCSFVGYLGDRDRRRVNLKRVNAHRLRARPGNGRALPPVIIVVGTSMDSGKTTAATKLVRHLVDGGVRVAACKITGSVSPRDTGEWRATGAHDVRDFSDYGFPSTYLVEKDELCDLFRATVADAAAVDPQVVVMEVADGVLQRETRILTECDELRPLIAGVVLTAVCSSSALFGLGELAARGQNVIAVSGLMTSAPLFVRELAGQTSVPVASSAGTGGNVAKRVLQHLGLGVRETARL